MSKDFGDFKSVYIDKDVESLCIRFSPSYLPLKQRWKNNGLSADFMGDYVTSFFPKSDNDDHAFSRQEEIRSAVSYIANEMLENAMKYSNVDSQYDISLTLYLTSVDFVFELTNAVTLAQNDIFIAFIELLRSSNPNDLYLKILEETAEQGNSTGLGCLSIINDYNAGFAWRFNDDDPDDIQVTTQISLAI